MPKRSGDNVKGRPAKRTKHVDLGTAFRWQSEQAKTKDLRIDATSLLARPATELEDSSSTPLATTLEAQLLINGSNPFTALGKQLRPLVFSVAQVLHHRERIAMFISEALDGREAELAAESIFRLIPPLLLTLPDPELLIGIAEPIFRSSLALALRTTQAAIIQAAFTTLALFFRELAKVWTKQPNDAWNLVREALGAPVKVEQAPIEQEPIQVDEPSVEEEEDAGLAEETFVTAIEDAPSPATERAVEDDAPRRRPRMAAARPDQRRLLASAFAFLVRKARGAADLAGLLGVLLEDAARNESEMLNESVADVLFESVKAVDGRLHSRADIITRTVLQHRRAPHAVLDRFVSSTAAHAPGDNILPIFDILLASSPSPIRLLKLIETPIGRRQATFTLLVKLAAQPEHDLEALIELSCLLLSSSSYQEVVSHGRQIIENLLKGAKVHAFALISALAELGWEFLPSIVLPIVLKSTLPQMMTSSTDLAFLATLASQGLLEQVMAPAGFASWVVGRLQQTDATEPEQVLELANAVSLSSAICRDDAAIAPALQSAVESLSKTTDAQAEHARTPASSAFLVTTLLAALKQRGASVDEETFDALIVNFGWHVGMLSLLTRVKGSSTVAEPAQNRLLANLTSEVPALRLAALELLPKSNIIDRCLDVEQMPISFQLARERCVKLRKVAPAVRNADEAGIAARYLVGSLKLNFKPVWEEAVAGLVDLAKRYEQEVWIVLGEQLQLAANMDEALLVAPRADWEVSPSEEEDVDPVQKAIGEALIVAREGWQAAQRRSIAKLQSTSYRLDIPHFELELLHVLERAPQMLQKRNAVIVDLFFAVFPVLREAEIEGERPKAAAARLANWLTTFSKLPDAKATKRSTELHQAFLGLLSHGDNAIQKLALACLLRWKSKGLQAFESQLFDLLEQSHFRDALLALSLSSEADVIQPDYRGEVVPVVVRILFGVATSRQLKSVASARRVAILTSLRSCSGEELDTLVDLMLAPFEDLASEPWAERGPKASMKRQVGFLYFLADVLKHLCLAVDPKRLPPLCAAALGMLRAGQGSTAPQARKVRVLGMQAFADFFRLPDTVSFDPSPFLTPAFAALISPRLPSLANETAQSPSALLDLAMVWAGKRGTIGILVDYDAALLPAIYATLVVSNVKPVVVSRIIDLLQLILAQAAEDTSIADKVVRPYVSLTVSYLATLLGKRAPDQGAKDDLGKKEIALVAALAPYIVEKEQAASFVELLLPLLAKPNKSVPENVKVDLLKILTELFPVAAVRENEAIGRKCEATLGALFAYVRSRPGRVQLVEAFTRLAEEDDEMREVATILRELNAFSARRLDEPDFDRRLTAFATLNEQRFRTLSPRQWTPLLHNAFSFIQDVEELSMRSNASLTLRRFAEVASTPEAKEVVITVLLPGLHSTLRSKEETVRVEVLNVWANAVGAIEGVPLFDEMRGLLVGGDVEANVFTNILHIQHHRRVRAMRRLAEEAEANRVSSRTLADIWVPLLSYFLDGTATADLANEAVLSIGRLSGCLNWSVYYRLLQERLKLASTSAPTQKLHVRTSVALLKGFHFDLTNEADGEGKRILEIVRKRLLPRLIKFLEHRVDNEEEVRIPVAEGIAALVQHLPEGDRRADASILMTSLSQILRSKSQDVRDQARSTLCGIAVSLGPSYLAIVGRDLKGALQRGPQVHVLAFTLHAVLVRLLPMATPEDVDAALEYVMPVVADDLWGAPAKEREADDFRRQSTYREVKSSKSLDSFQLLSAAVAPTSFARILSPLRDVMTRTEALKTMRVVDEALSRITQGIQANSHIDTFALLSLCNSLISLDAAFLRHKIVKDKAKARADYEVRMSRDMGFEADHYPANSHRFVALGLDLLNTAFRRNRFDLQDAETVARLDPLIAAVGDAVFSKDSHVLQRALRATAALVRCPLASVDKAAPLLTDHILELVLKAGGTQAETTQVALRTLATTIRDCKTVAIPEKQLTALLKLVAPDLEETDRQTTVFALLRALLSRKFACSELYDLMDRVAEVLVTNQAASVREACRAMYLSFLLDYPHGKQRLKAAMSFLVKNLGYIHESGRMSVMEILGAIITKFSPALLDDSSELFFAGLVMAVVNEESSKARQTAMDLVKVLLGRVSSERRSSFVVLLTTWADQGAQRQLAVVAVQLCATMIEGGSDEAKAAIPSLLAMLSNVVIRAAEVAEEAEREPEMLDEDETTWRLPYQALQALSRIFTAQPSLLQPTSQAELFGAVQILLLHPHGWVRTASARLIGTLFASPAADGIDLGTLLEVAVKSSIQLRSPILSEALALQLVKNLFYAGRRFATIAPEGASSDDEDDDGEEDRYDRETQPLRWLFARLAKQARLAHIARPSMYELQKTQWSLQPSSVLRWFAAMANALEPVALQRFLGDVLSVITRLIDDPNSADPQMAELQTLAREVQDLLEARVGTTAFTAAYTRVRQSAAERRQARKAQTAMKVVNDPELNGLLKAKRNTTKKQQKKRKSAAFAEQRERAHAPSGIKRRRV